MSAKTMKIHWQGDGWYATLDPAAEPLELVRIGDSPLSHQAAQEAARERGYTAAAFYIDPPPYAAVVTE